MEKISFSIVPFFVDYSKWIRFAIYFPGQFGGHSSSAPLKEGNGCSPQMFHVDLRDSPVTSKMELEIQLLYKESFHKMATLLDKTFRAIMRECV